MYELKLALESVRDFMELGGPVLTAIAALLFVMFVMVVERLVKRVARGEISVIVGTHALVEKLHEQKGITITHTEVEGAGHFFEEPHMDTMIGTVTQYVKRRLTETTR